MTDRIVVPGLDEFEQGVLDGMLAQLDAKTPRNLLRTAHYENKHFMRNVGSVIPQRYYRLGLTMGWSAKAVDMLTNRCNLDGFSWDGGDLESLGSDRVWVGNREGAEVNRALTASAKLATSFLVVTRGVESEGEPKALIHAKDALNCTGLWNPRRRGLDAAVVVTDRDGDGKPAGLALFLPDLTIVCEKDGQWSVVDRQEHALGVPVEPLPYRPQIGRPFGMSRITRPLMSAQAAATRTLIRMEGQADIFSYPQLLLLGAGEDAFRNADGTVKADWQVAMGRFLGIPDDQELLDDGNPLARASVQTITAQSPQPHIDHMRQHAQVAAGETSIPEIYFGVSDKANPTSADALFIQDLPLINASEAAADDWSPGVVRAHLLTLQIMNDLDAIPDEWLSLRPKWRSFVYTSRAAAADAGTKIAAAVPGLAETEVGLEMMGMTPDQIRRFHTEQRRANGRATLDALAASGAATQGADDAVAMKAKFDALGAAIRSGVDPESAAAALGLSGLAFTGAIPVSLRPPAAEASKLEQQ